MIRLRVVPSLGRVRLQSLSGGHLNGLYAELEQAGLSVSTRRLTHAVLHRALRDAVRWGKLVRNPADLADPPAPGRTRVTAWTAGELRRFLEHVEEDRLYALWRLAATTGMRRGELGGLTWRCLDLEGGRLSVEQQLVPTRGGVTFGEPKSARSRRKIALDPDTVDALQRYREAQLLERDFAGDAYDDQDLVFADELGGPIHPQRLTEWFRRHRRGRHPDRQPSRPQTQSRDAGAHVRRPRAHRGGAARGRSRDGARHVRALAPAVGRAGG